MSHSNPKPDSSRAQREHYFRQADRAWARALTCLLRCAAGRRAVARVLAARCTGEPDTGVWFHAQTATLETALSTLEATGPWSLRADRRYAGHLRITCDGIAAVTAHLDAPIDESLMRRVNEERARGHAWLHRLVIENLSLVSFWVHSHARTTAQEREDIEQAARQGLVRASQRFDVERGVQFATCALQWFRSFTQPQRDNTRCQVSASRADIRNLRRLHAVLEAHGLAAATTRDAPWLAEQLDLAVSEVNQLLILDHSERSIDAADYNPPVISASDDTEANAIALEQSKLCEGALATLDPRTQKIVAMRFGLGCSRPYDANEIARQLDLSVERVRQIYNAALRALRENHQMQSMATSAAVGT